MGIVYRGEHIQTGQAVALKTISTVGQHTLAGIRREIHALSRIHHPGIVRILAHGVADGCPWYAMELLAGSTLRDRIDELWTRSRPAESGAPLAGLASGETATLEGVPAPAPGPVPAAPVRAAAGALRAILELLQRLCAPLAFLHGSGIVHRDLKPGNILVRPDGTPVLVDFGIHTQFSGALGREELAAEGRRMGSVAYMSPEQIRGELVDARADLYALGCILYECLTGRPPFIGASASAVLFQHLSVAPEPCSIRVEGVPGRLDQLVRRLLEKRPQDRLGYADDVAQALAELGVKGSEPDGLPRSPPYVYRPELVGRADELREFERLLSCVGRGQGGCYLLSGESGVGKTRLLMEIARRGSQHGLSVIAGQCVALGAGREASEATIDSTPLHAFRPLLLAAVDRCREHPRDTQRLLGDRARVLSAYEPGLVDMLGPPQLPEPPPAEPHEVRARVLEALREMLFALADEQPLLLVLDDLQWADELSLAFLGALAQDGLEGRSILVVVAYRMEELHGKLAEIVRASGRRRLELQRLGDASVGTMVSGMLAMRDPSRSLVDFLVRQTNGNPFFIIEYLRAAISEGLLIRSPAGEWALCEQGGASGAFETSLPLPRTLSDLIEGRLGRISEPSKRLVQWASVLGRAFDFELLSSTADLDETSLMEGLETLRVRQIVEEPRPGQLRFVHDKLREIAYKRIPEESRRALHAKAAAVIETRDGERPAAAAALAHHFSRAGNARKASRYFALGGDYAVEKASRRSALGGDQVGSAHAKIEAASLYGDALAEARKVETGGGDGAGVAWKPTAHLAESLGDAFAIGGQREQAMAAYGDALATLGEPAPIARARLNRKIGKAWELQFQHDEALRAYARAEEALGGAPDGEAEQEWWHEWVQIQMERAWAHHWLAQVEALTELVEKVRPIIQERGLPLQRAHFLQSIMHMELRRSRYAASALAVQHAYASLAASEQSGDGEEICSARFALGFTLLFHGSLAEADECLGKTLEEAERIGDAPLQPRCLAFWMMVQRRRGRTEEARRLAERVLAVATDAKMNDYLGAAQANLGWAALRAGRAVQARGHLSAALEKWRALPRAYPFQWMALLPLLELELEGRGAGEVSAHAAAILDDTQQLLPGKLAEPLGEVARASPRVERPSLHLERAVSAAKRLSYL